MGDSEKLWKINTLISEVPRECFSLTAPSKLLKKPIPHLFRQSLPSLGNMVVVFQCLQSYLGIWWFVTAVRCKIVGKAGATHWCNCSRGMRSRRPGAGADGGLVCFGRTVASLALSSSGTVLPVVCWTWRYSLQLALISVVLAAYLRDLLEK